MPSWENAGRGGSYDIKNETLKIIAEVKNKHNTMNARSALSVYDNLQRHLDYSGDAITMAYLVEIVPKNPRPYQIQFCPSERGTRRPQRDDILKIDGKSFYAMASGDPDALEKLYQVLPTVLAQLLGASESELKDSPVFRDLFNRAYTL
jgi:hypothetical protein